MGLSFILFMVAHYTLYCMLFATLSVANPAGHSTHFISNSTLNGLSNGCKHTSTYFVTSNTKFSMCMGQTDQDLKNGMSIINLVNSRGYLPTCRVMQLMLWMASEVADKGMHPRDTFVDIGANIGLSCSE